MKELNRSIDVGAMNPHLIAVLPKNQTNRNEICHVDK